MAENTWTINDSAPVSLAQTFASPPAEWANADWLVGLGMVQAAQGGVPSDRAFFKEQRRHLRRCRRHAGKNHQCGRIDVVVLRRDRE